MVAITAVDVGARLVCADPGGRITRLEEAGRRFGENRPQARTRRRTGAAEANLAARMADSLFEAMNAKPPQIGTAACCASIRCPYTGTGCRDVFRRRLGIRLWLGERPFR